MVVQHEHFSIAIDDREARDLYPDLISLEVELDDEMASLFRLQLAISLQSDGGWAHIDDDRLSVWKRVDIEAGFEAGMADLMSGYITHVRPYFDPDPTQCVLEIWGMDGSVLMDREEKRKAWPNKKDSDIAREIFQRSGFRARIEDTRVIHDEKISTIMQRETDMRFLKRLAVRNGFECYVDGQVGYFRSPQLHGTTQPVLAAHFGDETNLSAFSVEVNALAPANVSMMQLDRTSKAILEAEVRRSGNRALGRTRESRLRGPRVDPGQIFVSMSAATGRPEMMALCQGLFHQAEWFVTGTGEVDANSYGHVLRPRQMVTIKGVGEAYSGVYYVSHVTHSFTADGYTQAFRVKRNAIFPTGSEDFSGTLGRLF